VHWVVLVFIGLAGAAFIVGLGRRPVLRLVVVAGTITRAGAYERRSRQSN